MNQNKTFAIIVGLIVLIIASSAALLPTYVRPAPQSSTYSNSSGSPSGNFPGDGSGTSAGNETTNPGPISFSLTDVAKHNAASSCWTAINGSVYDLTDWISRHPGGATPILSICGIDGSSAFNAQHSGDQQPADILATFRIGALTK